MADDRETPPLVTEPPSISKFEKYSNAMIKRLDHERKVKRGKIHGCQINAVMGTRAKILNDRELLTRGEHKEIKPVLIVAPTGAGKSGMVVLLPYVLCSKRVLIITPSSIISKQLGVEFGRFETKMGFLEKTGLVKKADLSTIQERPEIVYDTENIYAAGANLYIVNAQKFAGKAKNTLVLQNNQTIENVISFFGKFDTLIVDEAHHFPSATWKNILNAFRGSNPKDADKKIVFLTATPYKIVEGKEVFILDKEGGEGDRIAYLVKPEELKGVIRVMRFHDRTHKQDHGKVSKNLNIIHEDVVKEIMKIFSDSENKDDRITTPKAMILVTTIVEAKNLTKSLNIASGNKDFAVATISTNRGTLHKFETNKNCQVAVTCGIGMEGFDCADVVACIILRNLKSRVMFNQFIGRCMRLHRKLGGDEPDRTVGTVFSFKEFGQLKCWSERNMIANDHPVDEPEETRNDVELQGANVVQNHPERRKTSVTESKSLDSKTKRKRTK